MPSNKSKTKPKPRAQWQFDAIGTSWWIGFYESVEAAKLQVLQGKVAERIEEFDKAYSRFRSDSLVTQISKIVGSYNLPADAKPLIHLYRQLYEISDGAVTPLIGNMLAEAGYDAEYSLQPKELHMPPKWDDVMAYELGVLTTKEPILLDFGAAGKGYLVDIICELLLAQGIRKFCVDGSGDLRSKGVSLPIGLENPNDTNQIIGIATLNNQALCGSAGNRRAWKGYNHIMDPQTLASPDHIKASWVIASTTLQADILATALYFVPAAILAKHFSFSYLIVYADSSVECSNNFPAELFT